VVLFGKLFRLVWGDEVDRALRPVLAVSFAGATAFSAGWSFLGIWAIEELGATSREPGVGFLVGAVAASVAGYLGGHASDHLGRRPLILLGWGLQALITLSYIFVGHHVVLGLALVASGAVFGSIGSGADQAMVADLVAPERHEAAYAPVRVASNLGVAVGPPIGGLLLPTASPRRPGASSSSSTRRSSRCSSCG
jgi:predicted MFS family arabinose efflux permease